MSGYQPKDRYVILRSGDRERVIGPLPFDVAVKLTMQITPEHFRGSESWPKRKELA